MSFRSQKDYTLAATELNKRKINGRLMSVVDAGALPVTKPDTTQAVHNGDQFKLTPDQMNRISNKEKNRSEQINNRKSGKGSPFLTALDNSTLVYITLYDFPFALTAGGTAKAAEVVLTSIVYGAKKGLANFRFWAGPYFLAAYRDLESAQDAMRALHGHAIIGNDNVTYGTLSIETGPVNREKREALLAEVRNGSWNSVLPTGFCDRLFVKHVMDGLKSGSLKPQDYDGFYDKRHHYVGPAIDPRPVIAPRPPLVPESFSTSEPLSFVDATSNTFVQRPTTSGTPFDSHADSPHVPAPQSPGQVQSSLQATHTWPPAGTSKSMRIPSTHPIPNRPPRSTHDERPGLYGSFLRNKGGENRGVKRKADDYDIAESTKSLRLEESDETEQLSWREL
ncbi:hypothetical protein P152DRAFT_289685 [Eremomyces bilateralis CBS 781.70]|uniref:Uncharacterized protein n=1 Tax=Eremomyces bilateralis CBS 781.70 TaxID=1392243 RepID=A0A6G1G6M7_9PEZI|nr:uncharacterized protein P152DRAFT_289685 [Eremomyces bilateralis CBS 781.70]KAF1813717.1 hypothetical protein P152DRAFT_289685 [Eremomyces bilateralis CBS 781.70]